MNYAQIRHLALSLPHAVEKDHHGIPSFRINDKIFATMWDEKHLNVMLDPLRIEDVAKTYPKLTKEVFWGGRPSCVKIDLTHARTSFVKELMIEAYQRKARMK